MMMISDMQKELKYAVKNKEKTDLAFAFIRRVKAISYFNSEELKEQMVMWRKQRKEGKLVIEEYNNITKVIGGKVFHIFVVQPINENRELVDVGIDPMGLAFDEGSFMVTGFIYAFKTVENRDSIYKYVMGIK